MSKAHYFDYNATTPVAPEVLKAMLPYFSDVFANPSSSSSPLSWQSQSAIKLAQKEISKFLDCRENEIYFTSGATESINGLFEAFIKEGKNILVSDIDHDASFQKAKTYSKSLFFKSTPTGQVDTDSFDKILEKAQEGSLVSFILVHNELGTILDFNNLLKKIRAKKCFVHLDATQALGKIPFSFQDSGVDFLSCSAHKIYGPKGIGTLVVNKNNVPQLTPFLWGGGQQEGYRSGTLNTPLIVGMGQALKVSGARLEQDRIHYTSLKSAFLNELGDLDYEVNGDPQACVPNTLNLTFKNWNRLSPLYLELLPFSVSQSSACSSNKGGSRVLKSLGKETASSFRLSFGRPSSLEKTKELAQKIKSLF